MARPRRYKDEVLSVTIPSVQCSLDLVEAVDKFRLDHGIGIPSQGSKISRAEAIRQSIEYIIGFSGTEVEADGSVVVASLEDLEFVGSFEDRQEGINAVLGSFQLTGDQHGALQAWSKILKISRSELIRRCMTFFLTEQEVAI